MGETVSVNLRVDADDWEAFKKFVVETHGQKYGHLGREASNALAEYADRDRLERVDAKIDEVLARLDELEGTRTHKQSETVEKVEQIADRLAAKDQTVIKAETVRRAIEDVAGADDRTVEKYREQLKRRELAYEHPAAECGADDRPVWTLDREQWVTWAAGVLDNNPAVESFDLIEPYPDIGVDEFRGEVAEAVA